MNYRTTEQIRDWSIAMLHGIEIDDLDGGLDDLKGYTSLLSGVEPEVRCFETLQAEQDYIVETIRNLLQEWQAEEICLVSRTVSTLKKNYAAALAAEEIPHVFLGKHSGDEEPGIRLATMHRVKGLEFPCMMLAGVNDGAVPLRTASVSDDPSAQKEHETRERSLLFVAATRSTPAMSKRHFVTSALRRAPPSLVVYLRRRNVSVCPSSDFHQPISGKVNPQSSRV